MIRTRRLLGAGAATCAALLTIPAAGHAAGTTAVINDAGIATALTPGLTIRNMSSQFVTTFGSGDQFYTASYTYTPPGGSAVPLDAYSDRSCSSVPTNRTRVVDLPYLGNGTYSVSIRTSSGAKDFDCASLGAAAGGSVVVNAGTAIAPLPKTFLIRPKNSADYNDFSVGVDYNPGASFEDILIGKGKVAFNPDGSIATPLISTSVTQQAPVLTRKFFEPGDYTFVARATKGTIGTGWTPAQKVRMQEPFDLYSPYFTDSRGPRYKITSRTRGTRPSGRVTLSIKRRGAKKFRKVGSGKIRKTRRFGISFKLSKPGRYIFRFSYKGSAFMQKGRVDAGFKITRRYYFR